MRWDAAKHVQKRLAGGWPTRERSCPGCRNAERCPSVPVHEAPIVDAAAVVDVGERVLAASEDDLPEDGEVPDLVERPRDDEVAVDDRLVAARPLDGDAPGDSEVALVEPGLELHAAP